MKPKVYEAEAGTIDDAVYEAMKQRWADDNYKEAEIVDSRVLTMSHHNGVGYIPVLKFKVWVRDA